MPQNREEECLDEGTGSWQCHGTLMKSCGLTSYSQCCEYSLYGQTSHILVMWIWTVSELDVQVFVLSFLNGGREEVAS